MQLIPIERVFSNRDSIRRKAREAFLILKGRTIDPEGLNIREETFFFFFVFYFFFSFTGIDQEHTEKITKFTTFTLLTSYKERKRTTLHYTTLYKDYVFNLNLKLKSDFGNLRKNEDEIIATVVLMGVKVSIFCHGNGFCCFFSR